MIPVHSLVPINVKTDARAHLHPAHAKEVRQLGIARPIRWRAADVRALNDIRLIEFARFALTRQLRDGSLPAVRRMFVGEEGERRDLFLCLASSMIAVL